MGMGWLGVCLVSPSPLPLSVGLRHPLHSHVFLCRCPSCCRSASCWPSSKSWAPPATSSGRESARCPTGSRTSRSGAPETSQRCVCVCAGPAVVAAAVVFFVSAGFVEGSLPAQRPLSASHRLLIAIAALLMLCLSLYCCRWCRVSTPWGSTSCPRCCASSPPSASAAGRPWLTRGLTTLGGCDPHPHTQTTHLLTTSLHTCHRHAHLEKHSRGE